MTTSNNNITLAAEGLLTWLRENSEDNGAMADLRRGAGKTYEESITMHKWLNALAQKHGLWGWSRQVFYLVATLFVLAGKKSSDNFGNFGESAHAAEFTTRRFENLLTTEAVDLISVLPGIVQPIAAKNIPINFKRLFIDLVYWNGDYSRTSWAESYWAYRKPANQENKEN